MFTKLPFFLISLKHWQIFLIFVILPSLAMPFSHLLRIEISRIAYFLFVLVFVLWHLGIYNKVNQLIKKRGTSIKSPILFYALLIIPSLYSFLLILFYDFDIEKMDGNFFLNFLFGALHLISLFSYFYVSYVNAKNIKYCELKREPKTFSEFSNIFFLLLIFLVGLWNLQPKLNEFTKTVPSLY